MAYQRSTNELSVAQQPVCIHLRSKAMYVTGQLSPSHWDEVHTHHQDCWCNCTQHTQGPDRQIATPQSCTPERECYRHER